MAYNLKQPKKKEEKSYEPATYEYELEPKYDNKKDFYGKANVVDYGNRKVLRSYSTDVAEIKNGKAFVKGLYSQTTTRHIKEFLKQEGFKVENSKQIMKDYGNKEAFELEQPKEQKIENYEVERSIPNGRSFRIDNNIEIICKNEKARDGFRHRATLYVDGVQVDETTTHYQNRTWESYEFQSVMQKLIEKTSALSSEQKKSAFEWVKKDRTDWSDFKTTSAVARLGDVFGGTIKEKNDWKERMIKAGMGNKGLEIPDDWDKLTEKEKEKRLNLVIKEMENVDKKK